LLVCVKAAAENEPHQLLSMGKKRRWSNQPTQCGGSNHGHNRVGVGKWNPVGRFLLVFRKDVNPVLVCPASKVHRGNLVRC